MLSRVFFRPRPISITIGSDGVRAFGVTGSSDANGVTYNNWPVPWPGVWQLEMVGGGGGGGGTDPAYYRPGAAGTSSAYTVSTLTLRGLATTRVGAGGTAGTSGASPTAGGVGRASLINAQGNVINSATGTGGAAGVFGTSYNPTPGASAWPYTGQAGRGGQGATDTWNASSGIAGACRLKLVG